MKQRAAFVSLAGCLSWLVGLTAFAQHIASSGTGEFAAERAFDGNRQTRWSSDFSDPQWLQLDLGAVQNLVGLKILWENAYAAEYDILVSEDGVTWNTVAAVRAGDGGWDDLDFSPSPARYVRITGTRRATAWGYSIFEVQLKTAAEPWGVGEPRDVFIKRHWWFKPEPGDAAWRLLRTHASWQEQGLPDYRGIASYRQQFFVPANWRGAAPYLQLTDIRDRFELIINGKSKATLPGARRRHTLAVGAELKYGEVNTIQIKVTGHGPESGVLGSILLAADTNALPAALLQIKQRDPMECYELLAHLAPEGWYPFWLTQRQGYWTIVGVDGDYKESLFGEEGSLEPYKSFSITPFVRVGGRFITRGDGQLFQSLEKGFLPVPTAGWTADPARLTATAFAAGPIGGATTYVRYRVENIGRQRQLFSLLLALRPFEINPPWQWGGLNRIHRMEARGDVIQINEFKVYALTSAFTFGTCPADAADITPILAQDGPLAGPAGEDPAGFGCAALRYDFDLAPGAQGEAWLAVPLHPGAPVMGAGEPATNRRPALERLFVDTIAQWERRLAPLPFHCPDRELTDSARANLAYILLNRDGPAIQPGSRAYEAAWMRDGALTSAALLRYGYPDEVRQFLSWYLSKQYPDGRVPAIVIIGRNEINPVKEYDSQGQLIHALMQYYYFTHDRSLLAGAWPAVKKSLQYLEQLRNSELDETMKADPDRARYYGILPRSVSHEGYYPEPGNHSYWDDLWAIKGWQDAQTIARILNQTNELAWIERETDELRSALLASIQATGARCRIDYIPGCAELGDLDASATAIALTVCGADAYLPPALLRQTFERHYQTRFRERLQPGWRGSFSPYEFRVAEAFLRLGDKRRAWEMISLLLRYRQPPGWRQWPEAVYAPARQAGYIGDMPHTWAASGFLSAFRALFVYEDEAAGDLVLGAGIQPVWLKHKGAVRVRAAPTIWGTITYSMDPTTNGVSVQLAGNAKVPGRIIVKSPLAGPIKSATIAGRPARMAGVSAAIAPALPCALEFNY